MCVLPVIRDHQFVGCEGEVIRVRSYLKRCNKEAKLLSEARECAGRNREFGG